MAPIIVVGSYDK